MLRILVKIRFLTDMSNTIYVILLLGGLPTDAPHRALFGSLINAAIFSSVYFTSFLMPQSAFSGLESRMDLRFADMETRFARVNVMLGVILAALAIPVMQTVLLWVR